jgi:hypothetical protein
MTLGPFAEDDLDLLLVLAAFVAFGLLWRVLTRRDRE